VLVAERPWGFESLRPHQFMRYANHGLRFLLELLVFGAGVVALAAADQAKTALVLGALVMVHLGLTFVLGQRPRESAA
jgi:hypothetical protein